MFTKEAADYVFDTDNVVEFPAPRHMRVSAALRDYTDAELAAVILSKSVPNSGLGRCIVDTAWYMYEQRGCDPYALFE